MFCEEILSKIYSDPDIKDVPIIYLILITKTIEKILDEQGYDI